jgi:glutathione peroxidase
LLPLNQNLFMRLFIITVLAAAISIGCARVESRPKTQENNMSSTSFYDFKVKTIDGKDFDLKSLKGKKVLVVNTASECGYTPQYKDLQALHEKYKEKLTIIGFPANNFGGQEPGTNVEIKGFCEKNYGVTFQMMEKISVKGSDMHPLYKWLSTKEQNGWNNDAPNWNFCKFLIDENGQLLKFFNSAVKPMSTDITSVL